jgi:hypothetical protein
MSLPNLFTVDFFRLLQLSQVFVAKFIEFQGPAHAGTMLPLSADSHTMPPSATKSPLPAKVAVSLAHFP